MCETWRIEGIFDLADQEVVQNGPFRGRELHFLVKNDDFVILLESGREVSETGKI